MIPRTSSFPVRASESNELTVADAWRALRRGWLLVIASLVLCVAIAGVYTARQRKIFRSTATLEIDPRPQQPLGTDVQTVVDVVAGSYWNNREYYETQLRVIISSGVGQEVVRRLQLHRDGGFLANLPPGISAAAPPDATVEGAAITLQGRISLEPIKSSRLVMIHVEDATPARAQRILSTIIDTYLERNIDHALESANTASDWLNGQVGSLKRELERSEIELHNYKKDKAILSVSLDEQSNMLRREMTELNDAVTRVRAKIQTIQARSQELEKIDPENFADLSASELLSSSALQAMRRAYTDARSTRMTLASKGRGDNHPDMLSAIASENFLRDSLRAEIRNIQASVARDLVAARAEAAGLNELFRAAEKRALDLNLLEIEYRKREREKVNTEKLYTLVLERSKASELTRMMRFNNLHVIEPASAPRKPVHPNIPTNLGAGVVIGLLLGMGAALARDRLDRTIKAGEALEQLGLPWLGALPRIDDHSTDVRYGYGIRRRARRKGAASEARTELIVHEQPKSGVAEAARAVRTSIRFSSPDQPYRCLLVTSAGPSEGKTTVACCIATAMAQAGQRTLLIDCDLRRPRLHKVFELSGQRGITEAIFDLQALDFAAPNTPVDNLYVLPAGPFAPNPADLIGSERFGAFLDYVRKRFDMVILDSPPILPVTDATILATRADATILVARSNKTTKDHLHKAARMLRDVGATVVGAVLNGMNEGRRYAGEYYAYYGHTEDPANDPPKAAAQ